jgi:hypothetical protein
MEVEIEDSILRDNFSTVLNSWKDSVLLLYNKQREQLVSKLSAILLSSSEAQNIQKLLKDPNSIQEVGEFTAFMKIIGLSNHNVFQLLNDIFKETLPKYFNNTKAKSALKKAKQKEQLSKVLTGIFVGIGTVYFFVGNTDNKFSISLTLDIIGIVVGVWVGVTAGSSEMKNFRKVFAETINKIDSTSITYQDFNLKSIEAKTGNNNYDTLDN